MIHKRLGIVLDYIFQIFFLRCCNYYIMCGVNITCCFQLNSPYFFRVTAKSDTLFYFTFVICKTLHANKYGVLLCLIKSAWFTKFVVEHYLAFWFAVLCELAPPHTSSCASIMSMATELWQLMHSTLGLVGIWKIEYNSSTIYIMLSYYSTKRSGKYVK